MAELNETWAKVFDRFDYDSELMRNGSEKSQIGLVWSDLISIADRVYANQPEMIQLIESYTYSNPDALGKEVYASTIADFNYFMEKRANAKKVQKVNNNVVNISDYKQVVPENTIQMPQQVTNEQNIIDISGYTNSLPNNVVQLRQDLPVAVGENIGRTR